MERKDHAGNYIPADVPAKMVDQFRQHYEAITKKSGKLFLFACDQKLEHLNADFHGSHVDPQALDPRHLFTIAQQAPIGAMATHLGLIARYGKEYPGINYIVKMNGKTNLRPDQDPLSINLWNVAEIIRFKQESQLPICGIGLTLYLGSKYEAVMLKQAAQAITQAHAAGLIAIIWIYLRGKTIDHPESADLIAGAAGVGASLGADFVKLKEPRDHQEKPNADLLKIVTTAAGNTRIICAGGSLAKPELFLQRLHQQITIGGTAGCATGRNIFQRNSVQALALSQAIADILFNNYSPDQAFAHYEDQLHKTMR